MIDFRGLDGRQRDMTSFEQRVMHIVFQRADRDSWTPSGSGWVRG